MPRQQTGGKITKQSKTKIQQSKEVFHTIRNISVLSVLDSICLLIYETALRC